MAALPAARTVQPSARSETFMKLRYLVPLMMFVVPTVVIGYGFVIPNSPIAGLNELTVGSGHHGAWRLPHISGRHSDGDQGPAIQVNEAGRRGRRRGVFQMSFYGERVLPHLVNWSMKQANSSRTTSGDYCGTGPGARDRCRFRNQPAAIRRCDICRRPRLFRQAPVDGECRGRCSIGSDRAR